jgi:hypothetical protein
MAAAPTHPICNLSLATRSHNHTTTSVCALNFPGWSCFSNRLLRPVKARECRIQTTATWEPQNG